MEDIEVGRHYAGHPTVFSIRLHHGGEFTKFPSRKYINGKTHYVDLVDVDTFSTHDIDDMMDELGYIDDQVSKLYYHFQRPLSDLDFGLFALASDDDIRHLATFVGTHKLIEVYTEHGNTKVHTYSMSPNQSKVRIVELPQTAAPRNLYLSWHTESNVPSSSNLDKDSTVPSSSNLDKDPVQVDQDDRNLDEDNQPPVEDDDGENNNYSDNSVDECDDEFTDSDDSDYFVDEANILDDVDVDMKDFHLHIDKDVEWVGGSSKANDDAEVREEGDLEVLNNDVLLSGSSSNEGMDGQRKKSVRAIRRAHENDSAMVSEPFYLYQSFRSAEAFKEKVKLHAIKTRRDLFFEKNDKNRVRVICNGTIPNLGGSSAGGSGQQNVNQVEEIKCPWILYCSKWKRDRDWMVKTYKKEHRCLQTRSVKACDYKFLSKQVVQQVENNPLVPIRALRNDLQRQYQMDISKMKAFRAKSEAIKQVRGDYASQYALLRDYAFELQARNPDTTVKLDVESEPNPHVQTRTFRRIYVCLGALKKGFAAGKRDFLGLDGAFMKGPFPGQILTAVGLDGNNGVYPLAYALVEAETLSSWTWFLNNLGDDLGLTSNSNFTFITDRQKGVLPAIAKLFPCAENRYCLRHIHENMKLRWKGKEFKDQLWKCATTCNIQQFHHAMEELRLLNKETYEWLKQIPPQHWARSHFTGRAHCDALLNNLCESFNSKLEDGRDAPIITCLEFIREYIMKKIVNVEKAIQKASGPLTPSATKTFDKIKDEAAEYIATFCGDGKYQISGPWQDQCVVDMVALTCSCKKWEITGIPCKHSVAAIWNMRTNNIAVGIPESFVHPCYWLSTWKEMYSFKVGPINGRSMWEKSPCPSTLLPPKHRATIGRPKKKRKKSALEVQELLRGNTVSRAHRSVTCAKCKNTGHNTCTCKGQRAGDAQNRGNADGGHGNGRSKQKTKV